MKFIPWIILAAALVISIKWIFFGKVTTVDPDYIHEDKEIRKDNNQ